MARVLPSSAERRLDTFRHTVTLDLFTQHGPLWQAVTQMREEQRISPRLGLPRESRHADLLVPADRDPNRGNGWSQEKQDDFVEWKLHLEELHDRFIPFTCRIEGVNFRSADFWAGFLSLCIMFDPVSEDLLVYADYVVPSYAAFYEAFADWAGSSLDHDGTLSMLAPPIRLLPDTETIMAVERERHERTVAELHKHLEPHGIDVHELVNHIEYYAEETTPNQRVELSRRPYIVVESHTTETDVRNAFRLIATGQPRRPRPVKTSRDPLVAVQCALWYDRHHWTLEKIAHHFNWTVQYPVEAKPRCENARQYIVFGRKILKQRMQAANSWKHELAAEDSWAIESAD